LRTHIALGVRDLAASRDFYRVLLGQEPLRTQPGYVQFLSDHMNLALTEGPVRARSEGHFGLEVASAAEVLGHLERARAGGLQVAVEAAVACCYAIQDKFWSVDPDGNRWEVFFVQSRQMDLQETTPGGCCTAS
jgi:catechol 2,3-dioxygenase-like lactoylglutathione lyase family enzyme